VEPAAEADQGCGGAVDVADAVQQPAPAAQRPRACEVADRLFHQRAQPGLEPVVGALLVGEPVLGAPVADRRVPVLAVLAIPRNPRSTKVTTSVASSTWAIPDTWSSSCSWQLPGQPPSTHSRSPCRVDTAMPCAVWVWRLGLYSTFWLPQPAGRCTRVASPSTRTGSPAWAISASRRRRSSRLGMKVPSGWQTPSVTSSPSSMSRLSPTSLLQIPTMRPARR
jgi:hypothetical protein